MFRWRWLSLVLILTTFVGLAPAYAQEGEEETPPKSGIIDRGNNVYDVDPFEGELFNLLPGEDVEKISKLQNITQDFVAALSPISPDDQAMLVAQGDGLGFMDVNTGEIEFFDPDVAFARYIPVALLDLTPWSWQDGRTLISLGLDRRLRGIVLVQIDRITGSVRGIPLRGLNSLRAQIVSNSPDGRRVLLAFPPEEEEEARGQISVSIPTAMPKIANPLEMDGQLVGAARQHWESILNEFPAFQELRSAVRIFNKFQDGTTNVVAKQLSLKIFDAETGDVTELLKVPVGAAFLSDPAWSQDSAKLALSLLKLPDIKDPISYRDINGFGALISEEFYRDLSGNLKPAENPWLQTNTVESFDLNTGDRKTLAATAGDGTMVAASGYSTDGQHLLVQHGHPSRLTGRANPVYFPVYWERISWRIYNQDLKETNRLDQVQLSSNDFAGALFVSPDEVLFRTLDKTDLGLFYYNRVSGEFRKISSMAGTHGRIRPTRLSRQVLFLYSSFTKAPDIYKMNWDGSAISRLTWAAEELNQSTGITEHQVSFRLANGQTRSGLLVLPAGVSFPPKNIPIVVWQEGGPTSGMPNVYGAIVERPYALLPSFGFGLLSVPLSGRWGYGPELYRGLYNGNNFGQIDIDEQAEITRQMISRGWTSRSNVGIVGCSYGGYFVLQSLIRHPDLYAAANAQCALVDVITTWTQGSAYPPAAFPEGLPPWANLEEYRRDSPLFNAEKIRTPLLTFHGTFDFLPISFNENLHLLVVNRKVPAKMLHFIGAGHGLADPDYQLYAAQEQILWFRQYLKK